MRLAASAGLFALTFIVYANISTVHAESLDISNINIENKLVIALETKESEKDNEKSKEVKIEETIHKVSNGENLSKIAEQYATTWKRIFDKNTNLINPDVINPGDKLVIPNNNEVLADRPVAAVESEAIPAQKTVRTAKAIKSSSANNTKAVSYQSRGQASGNTYSPGYCTWYAKNKRPDLPNNLGNANTWVSRAAAQGLATGSAPRVGAIGQQGMHVVYVESVNPGNTVTISEMNYNGLYVVSSRTVPASTFQYLY